MDSLMLITTLERETYTVTIEHYGPVFDPNDQNSIEPVKIEKRVGVSSGWTDVTGDFDIIAASFTDPNDRTITITPSTGNAWEGAFYRVSPDELECKDVGLSVDVEYSSICPIDSAMDNHYSFSVTTQSNCTASADVNGDGSVTPTDFTSWINAFNNSLPACDQNNDCLCTPTDFTAWINNYNNGCL